MANPSGFIVYPALILSLATVFGGTLSQASIPKPRRTELHNHEFEVAVRAYVEASLSPLYKKQSRRIAAAVLEYSAKYGLDPVIVLSIIKNETRFNPRAVGSHGEVGLMQIRPETARWICERNDLDWKGNESLFDPVTNIRIGTAYLAYLRTEFGPDMKLSLSAYNVGASKLRRALSRRHPPKAYVQRTMEHYKAIQLHLGQSESAQAPDRALE